jgi:hypothetical protein
MSEKPFFEDHPEVIRLRVWALGQMVWGAFMAGIFLAILAGVLGAIWVVSQLLDHRSKEMPSPYGMIEVSQPISEIV